MVRILTWNVRGAMSSTLCLNSLLDNTHCDIAVISEHKLKNQHNGKMYLDSIHKDYLSIVKIDENDTYTTPNVYFIGKGGVAILIRKSLVYTMKEIKIDSKRVIGVEVQCKHVYFWCILTGG